MLDPRGLPLNRIGTTTCPSASMKSCGVAEKPSKDDCHEATIRLTSSTPCSTRASGSSSAIRHSTSLWKAASAPW
jgi:hypothetical protein